MRTDWTHLEPYRLRTGDFFKTNPGDHFGFFIFTRGGRQIRAMAADGEETGWEHVSVSALYRSQAGKITHPTPTWDEMCEIKDHFFEKEECVVQFHPPESEYVNIKENCLHLWRKVGLDFPRPPQICV
jgi:hypothetical protein